MSAITPSGLVPVLHKLFSAMFSKAKITLQLIMDVLGQSSCLRTYVLDVPGVEKKKCSSKPRLTDSCTAVAASCVPQRKLLKYDILHD